MENFFLEYFSFIPPMFKLFFLRNSQVLYEVGIVVNIVNPTSLKKNCISMAIFFSFS